ncbi:radical SAM family heme chaperone HemW [Euzebya pacifica]|uniref:radical SAM family heme chaperone HemW n=1 Tax=Euzebya pacifica TaxID=1608957 RepID=UPI0030F776CC
MTPPTAPASVVAERLPGIYVHVPFCLRRCDYCDFTTFADRDEAIPAYVEALTAHIRRTPQDATFGSVFVGGGTPTYLPPDAPRPVLQALGDTFEFADDAEWTVEANPETVDAEMAAALAGGGVNRISLGAQSFDTRVLSTLGRWHDPDSVPRAIGHLRDAGIDRLSIDLIYGTPGETDASWAATLDRAVELGTSHVSAYALTVEPNTPYAARVRTDDALAPDEDVQAARMAVTDERLGAAGMHRYEVSNWARPGLESRHNLTYWRGNDWLAFGSGAHGAWEGRRYWLVRDPDKYARMVAEGHEPLGGQEHPDAEARRLERLMMGLRVTEGVPREEVVPLDPGIVARLMGRGLLTMKPGDRLALTPAGMPLAGAVIRELA